MAKLTKQSITELVRIVVTATISILTTLGIISCTVYSGNQTESRQPVKTAQTTNQSNDNYNY